jgi:opacity protein-like surface antigen
VALLLCAGSPAANAVDLTLLAGYQFNADFELNTDPGTTADAGGDIELDDGASFGVALDFVFNGNPDQRLGLFVSRQQTEFDPRAGLADDGMAITHLHFTGTSYYPAGNWEPFVTAGIGAAFVSPDDASLRDSTRFSAQIGAGANYRLGDTLLLRFELRWLPTFFDGGASGICSGGCSIALKSDTYSQLQANLGLQFRF